MGKEVAVKKEKGGALAKSKDYREDLKKYAQDQSANEPAGGGGNFISIKGKKFSFKGDKIPEPLKVIIIDYSFVNKFYDSEYDEENPQPPACFALAKTEDAQAPHDTAPDKQADACSECEKNQFGSAEKGRGKACKNIRRLAVMNADVDELTAEYVKNADIAFLELPPTALSHFKGYLKKITQGLSLPLWAVVTSFSFDEESDYALPVPQLVSEVDEGLNPKDGKALLAAILERAEEVQQELLTPPDVTPRQPREGKGKKAKEKDKPKDKGQDRPKKAKF